MASPEAQDTQNHKLDVVPVVSPSAAEISHQKLIEAMREVNGLGAITAITPTGTAAFKAHIPALPDGNSAESGSYLDVAVHKAVDPLTKSLGGSQAACDEVTFYTKSLIKTAPLFMEGKVALGSLAMMYVADEAKPQDDFSTQLTDATLGLTKGLLLAGSFSAMRQANFTPSLTAVGLGVSNRAIETGLTRNNYYDQQGNFSIGTGLLDTVKTTFNPMSLAIDGSAMFLGDGLWGAISNKTSGRVRFNPLVTHALTAGTFGAATGMESEAYRQWKEGKMDLPLLIKRTAEQGSVNLIAGSLGGLQTRSALRVGTPDAPSAVEEARNTPYQRGEGPQVDARQALLRDGTFVKETDDDTLLSTTTYFGHVKTAQGDIIPSVFRPAENTELFARRMQSEIANYDLNQMIGYVNRSPATVAKTVVIDGKPVSGFVQELRGPTLVDALKGTAQETQGSATTSAQIKAFRENPALQTAYKESFIERMVLGEWDNHALNQTLVTPENNAQSQAMAKLLGEPEGPAVQVPNIDFGHALKAPLTASELLPTPARRTAFEGLSASLYRELAGKPIPEATRQKLAYFVETSATEAGQERLRAMGLTDKQVTGVVARAGWFAENPVFPSEPETLVFQLLNQVRIKYLGRTPKR